MKAVNFLHDRPNGIFCLYFKKYGLTFPLGQGFHISREVPSEMLHLSFIKRINLEKQIWTNVMLFQNAGRAKGSYNKKPVLVGLEGEYFFRVMAQALLLQRV